MASMQAEPNEINGVPQTQYQLWQRNEGIPIIGGYYVPNLAETELGPWPRFDAFGSFVDLEGTDEGQGTYILEIPHKCRTPRQSHLYEQVIYVVQGAAEVTLWNPGDDVRSSFPVTTRTVFGVPPNVNYTFTNSASDTPARLLVVTSAPLVMNLFHNYEFVFNNDFVFADRFMPDSAQYDGDGTALPGGIWQTHLVRDAGAFELEDWPARGGGGRTTMFELARGTLTAHVSEFAPCAYKKAHRHGAGAHVVILTGRGYSLMWPPGGETQRVDWAPNSLIVPPEGWFHQHFNPTALPARYLALRWESRHFPLRRWTWGHDVSLTRGGDQIEYEDEDPAIRSTFEQEVASPTRQ